MDDWLTDQFEEHRRHLFAVAYRMLGSTAAAEDAVQEAWLRLHRSDAAEIDNLGGWLTTVVSRISLNLLRARATHREDSLDEHLERLPEPIVSLADRADGADAADGTDPAEQAVLADSVGIALLVVLNRLAPAERLAFVLHDLFGLPFDEIAPIVERTPAATRQLASRARRQVRGQQAAADRDVARQRVVVDAFFAAAHDGDLARLISVLDPDVVLDSDLGSGITRYRGADKVAANAIMYAHPERIVHPALVDGSAGVVITRDGSVFSVMAFTVADGRIVEIKAYASPDQTERIGRDLGLA